MTAAFVEAMKDLEHQLRQASVTLDELIREAKLTPAATRQRAHVSLIDAAVATAQAHLSLLRNP